jgi:hypothetical protein
MHLGGLGATAEQLVEERVKSDGGIERQPDFTARRAYFNGHTEYYGCATLLLGEPGPPRRLTLSVIAGLTSHQRRLLR